MLKYTPDDPGFQEAAKVWNGDISKKPSLVLEPTDADQVAEALKMLMAEGHSAVSCKGGGHNVSGSAIGEDLPMISLTRLRAVHWNDEESYVDVGGGCLASDIIGGSKESKHVVVGLISTTGVGGLTLGGGVGWMSRKHGLAIDNLLEVDIVTPSLGLLEGVSATNHPDLFWALRGGGGNFGVVTRFRFRIHHVALVVVGMFVFERPTLFADILAKYEAFCLDEERPDDISVYAFLERDRLVLMAVHVSTSVETALERYTLLVQPIASWAPDITYTDMKPISELNSQFDSGNAAGKCYYWKSNVLDRLPIDSLVQLIAEAPEGASIEVMHWRGAISRVGPRSTAFHHREASFEAHSLCAWSNSERREALVAWGRRFAVSDKDFVNIVCESGRDQSDALARSFGPNMERLRQVKHRYDPDNIMRLNHNIV